MPGKRAFTVWGVTDVRDHPLMMWWRERVDEHEWPPNVKLAWYKCPLSKWHGTLVQIHLRTGTAYYCRQCDEFFKLTEVGKE